MESLTFVRSAESIVTTPPEEVRAEACSTDTRETTAEAVSCTNQAETVVTAITPRNDNARVLATIFLNIVNKINASK